MSLGEGACSEGEFWESLNTACNLHLPVLYVVPDNGFAISVPASDQAPAPVAELVRGFRGLEIHRLDGTDYFAVRDAAESIVAHIRAGVGPALIHADVVRPYSHSAADTQSKYRSLEELDRRSPPRPASTASRPETCSPGGVLTTPRSPSSRTLRAEAREIVDAKATAEALGRSGDPTRPTVGDQRVRRCRCSDLGPARTAEQMPTTAPRRGGRRWARPSSARCTR